MIANGLFCLADTHAIIKPHIAHFRNKPKQDLFYKAIEKRSRGEFAIKSTLFFFLCLWKNIFRLRLKTDIKRSSDSFMTISEERLLFVGNAS